MADPTDTRARQWTVMTTLSGTHGASRAAGMRMLGVGVLPLLVEGGVASFDVLAYHVRRVRGRRAMRRLLADAGDTVDIAAAEPGRSIRVEGTVTVIDSVAVDGPVAVGAYALHRVTQEDCKCSSGCNSTVQVARGRSEVGTFALRDATGVLLVDDPRLVLLDDRARGLDPDADDRLAVRDGAVVVVIGTPVQKRVNEPRVMGPASYRDANEVLVLDGSGAERTHVFVARRARL